MWIPNAQEWGFFGSVLGCISTFYAGWRKFDKRTQKVEQATATLQPNGGSSLADAIRRIETAVEKLDGKQDSQCELLSNLTGRFDQHVVESARIERGTVLWRRNQERSPRT